MVALFGIELVPGLRCIPARPEAERLLVELRPSLQHEELGLVGLDENRLPLGPRAAHDHSRQPIGAGARDRRHFEAVAEHRVMT
jgi:hypothetical protein